MSRYLGGTEAGRQSPLGYGQDDVRTRREETLVTSSSQGGAVRDSFGSKATLEVGGSSYQIYRLDAVDGLQDKIARLPYSLKILMENLLRTEDGKNTTADHIRALAAWDPAAEP